MKQLDKTLTQEEVFRAKLKDFTPQELDLVKYVDMHGCTDRATLAYQVGNEDHATSLRVVDSAMRKGVANHLLVPEKTHAAWKMNPTFAGYEI